MTPDLRAKRNGHPGSVIWLTGLSGAGKTTIAHRLEEKLFRTGHQVFRLDGDELRRSLSADLGFSAAARAENIRRAAAVAQLFADAGLICIAAFISPLRSDRDRAREIVGTDRFMEIYVSTPVEICRRRDPKGLYARADRGEIPEFTGVSAPYEPPSAPDMVIETQALSADACADQILRQWARRFVPTNVVE